MKWRLLLLGFGLLVAASTAGAQIIFTINASPLSDALGYVTTQTYNFAFTLSTAPNAGSAGTASNVSPVHYDWYDEFTFHPAVWSNVAGNGLAGAWVQPIGGIADDASHIIVTPFGSGGAYLPGTIPEQGYSFRLYAGADQTNIGLTATGKPVAFVYFWGDFTGLNFSNITGATLPNPNVYFAGFTASYSPTSAGFFGWIRTTDFDQALFTVNSLSITQSVSAVPEPATYAVLAGVAALGLAFWRRRNSARRCSVQ